MPSCSINFNIKKPLSLARLLQGLAYFTVLPRGIKYHNQNKIAIFSKCSCQVLSIGYIYMKGGGVPGGSKILGGAPKIIYI